MNQISSAENLRLYVLENTLYVEDLLCQTLGNLLDIDWKKSKSFGFDSTALSFNQKIHIIQDIKGIDKTESLKLGNLLQIRNKFVHVKSIESFSDLFLTTKNGNEIKRNLDKWYSNIVINEENEELKFKKYFSKLITETCVLLIKIVINNAKEKGVKMGNEEYKKIYIKILEEEIAQSDDGNQIFDRIYKKMDIELKEIEKKTFLEIDK